MTTGFACSPFTQTTTRLTDLRTKRRTTLELPDPLFARLKARAAQGQITLKQLLCQLVEQGLNDRGRPAQAVDLPDLNIWLALADPEQNPGDGLSGMSTTPP